MSQCVFLHDYTPSHLVSQAPPAFQAWLSLVLSLHVKQVEPDEKLRRLDCFCCRLALEVYFSVWSDEREGVFVCLRERERLKLQGATLKQPPSTGQTMEFKGVWVLLGLLLLVNCSLQQSQPRRKPVKKGRKTSGNLQEELQKFSHHSQTEYSHFSLNSTFSL